MTQVNESSRKHVVTFDVPVRGRDVVAAVQAACEVERPELSAVRTEFYREEHGLGTVIVGQSSLHSQYDLLVSATDDDPCIGLDEQYSSIVVSAHDWPGEKTAIRFRDLEDFRDAANSVALEFATKLPGYLPAEGQKSVSAPHVPGPELPTPVSGFRSNPRRYVAGQDPRSTYGFGPRP